MGWRGMAILRYVHNEDYLIFYYVLITQLLLRPHLSLNNVYV